MASVLRWPAIVARRFTLWYSQVAVTCGGSSGQTGDAGMSMQRMLLLSGAVGAGKTAVAQILEAGTHFRRLSTSGYLRNYGNGLGSGAERLQLQELGDQLDLETDFRWVVDDVALPAFAGHPSASSWLLDAVRKSRQVEHFRERLGPLVRHVHLRAPEDVLRERYTRRLGANDTPYDSAITHPNEVAARNLEHLADLVFDTSRLAPTTVASSILALWEA